MLELEDIAQSDMAVIIEDVNNLCEANLKHNPSLATKFKLVIKFMALHGASVSDGIARKRAEKDALAAARKAGASEAAATGHVASTGTGTK